MHVFILLHIFNFILTLKYSDIEVKKQFDLVELIQYCFVYCWAINPFIYDLSLYRCNKRERREKVIIERNTNFLCYFDITLLKLFIDMLLPYSLVLPKT